MPEHAAAGRLHGGGGGGYGGYMTEWGIHCGPPGRDCRDALEGRGRGAMRGFKSGSKGGYRRLEKRLGAKCMLCVHCGVHRPPLALMKMGCRTQGRLMRVACVRSSLAGWHEARCHFRGSLDVFHWQAQGPPSTQPQDSCAHREVQQNRCPPARLKSYITKNPAENVLVSILQKYGSWTLVIGNGVFCLHGDKNHTRQCF